MPPFANVITPDLRSTRSVDDEIRERVQAENLRLGEKGLRVLATGRKDFDPASFDPNADLLPLLEGMTLLALIGIVDPPRPTAKVSIAEAHAAGIQVRMITGDHAVTASAIAAELGIRGKAITGAEFRAMTEDEAIREIDDIGVIARVAPEDKVHLVDILRRKGHIVSMTGDADPSPVVATKRTSALRTGTLSTLSTRTRTLSLSVAPGMSAC